MGVSISTNKIYKGASTIYVNNEISKNGECAYFIIGFLFFSLKESNSIWFQTIINGFLKLYYKLRNISDVSNNNNNCKPERIHHFCKQNIFLSLFLLYYDSIY